MSSWVKVSRKLLTSAIGAKPEYLAVWMHLILSASYKEGDVLVGHQVITLQPGQLVFGRIKFSQQIGVSEHTLRMALKALETLQQITIKSHSKFSVITVTNWAKYQTDSPANHQQTTSKQPASNHNKEVLEIQEESILSSGDDDDRTKRVRYAEIQAAYNEICSPCLPACHAMSDTRKRQIKAMTGIVFGDSKPFTKGIEVWRQYFTDCLTNDHWCGKSEGGWRANFDFVTNPKNAIKLMEMMN